MTRSGVGWCDFIMSIVAALKTFNLDLFYHQFQSISAICSRNRLSSSGHGERHPACSVVIDVFF